MKTALLAWEIGGGAGSLLRLGLVARALRERGWRTAFAARDLMFAAELLADDASPRFQAPLWTRPLAYTERAFGAASYGDALAFVGYTDRDSLAAALGGWDALFAATGASLVVADNAPTACLAARGALPCALTGDGFALPPDDVPAFPPLHPHLPPIASEARILECIGAVQARRGRPSPATLPALLAAPVRALCAVPPLDPYAALRRGPGLGPLGARPVPTSLPLQASLLSCFALDEPDAEPLTDALSALEVPAASLVRDTPGSLGPLPIQAMLSGRRGTLARLLEMRGWKVLRRSDLAAALPAAAIVAHHGTPDLAEAALLAGRPQIVLPTAPDERVVARMIEALGCGIALPIEKPAAALGAAVRHILMDQACRDRATFWAKRLAEELPPDPLEDVAARAAALA